MHRIFGSREGAQKSTTVLIDLSQKWTLKVSARLIQDYLTDPTWKIQLPQKS